ncbi:EboA domain-containing protein [Vallicoccus soli]|uniref:EboA domain-containing protein n=1 Tax=Vallicoccus soli TaxID=2339232 RepID=UPI0015ABEC7B|nr:EboA domain-containing protein [Vallicoccus soli]
MNDVPEVVPAAAAGAPAVATVADVWALLGPEATAWLRQAVADVALHPERVRSLFPAVGRRCGRAPLDPSDPQGLLHGTVDDAARLVLLVALPLSGEALATEVGALYRYGDAAERRGVLRALQHLDAPHRVDGVGDRLVPVLHDALRTNDVRLVAGALGPYARHLDASAWRQAVLKCVFVGVPLAAVHDLAERSDEQLATMLVAYAHERVAAGRDVPADVWDVVDRFPHVLAASPIHGELASPVPERAAAARRALQGRPAAPTTTTVTDDEAQGGS